MQGQELVARESRRRRARRRLVFLLVAVAAVIVVVLLLLIALGVLVLPASTPTPVTVTSVTVKIIEGTTATGAPWFGQTQINYTGAEGYPYQIGPGKSWSVPIESLTNFDSQNHSIYTVTPTSPFVIQKTIPTIPKSGLLFLPHEDEYALSIYVTAPNTPGRSYALTLTLDAYMTP